jgi:hypothetical protein
MGSIKKFLNLLMEYALIYRFRYLSSVSHFERELVDSNLFFS